MKKINKKTFIKELQTFLYEMCLNEKDDISFAISMLSDAWYYLFPIEDRIVDSTISFFKNAIRNLDKAPALTSIAHMFSLMQRFSEKKKKYAPLLYKTLVLLMLETYDNEIKREFYLIHFEKFFSLNQTVPIDIMLDPYMKQIKNCKNYTISDVNFVFKIIEHPRIKSSNVVDIIAFVLRVTLYNLYLSRSANLILSLVFEKKYINELCNQEERDEIYKMFIDYIKTALDLFVSNLDTIEDQTILETPYDILCEGFEEVYSEVKEEIIKGVSEYRKIKGKNSTALLGMMWFFDEHDDVLMELEEEYREVYPPVVVKKQIVKKKVKKEKQKEETKTSNNPPKKEEKKEEKKEDKQEEKKEVKVNNKLKKEIIKEEKKEIKQEQEEPNQSFIKTKRANSKSKSPHPQKKNNHRYEKQNESAQETKTPSPSQSPKILSSRNEKNPKILPKIRRMPSTAKNINSNNNSINTSLLSSITKPLPPPKKKTLLRSSSCALVPVPKNFPPKPIKDDIHEKFGTIMSIDRRKQMETYKKQLFELNKVKSSKQLILKEGTLINGNDIYSNSISNLSKQVRSTYITSEVYKHFILPINLDEEEDREIKAINGYNNQYKKNIKLYFKTYGEEITNQISRSSLMKMFRDKGYKKSDLSLDELIISTRNIFGDNISAFNYEQFCNLLIQLSYLIYTKRRDTLTISECYGNLLRRFVPNKLTDATIKLNRKMKPVIDLIKQKLTNPIDEEDSYFNMPPGFKIAEKTSVVYNCRLPPHFLSFLSEGKYICYELVEEILFNILNSSTIEPYVKVSKGDNIEIEPGTIKRWTPGMTIAYVKLDTEYEKSGIEVADCLDDAMRRFFKGVDKNGEKKQSKKEIEDKEEIAKYLEKENEKELMRIKRRKEIKEKVEEFKKERTLKLQEKEKKEKQRQIEKMNELKEQIRQIREINKKKFEIIRKRKKEIEEEKMNKYLEEQQKAKEEETKKYQQRKEFFNIQQRKLKEQFRLIKSQKEIMYKQNYDLYIQNMQKIESNPSYLDKDKEYIEFEKKLNSTLNELKSRNDFSEVISKYNSHLHVIYDIYSKIGYRKINFYSKESIQINEFKEFLTNFTVLGILINTEQMNYIYNKITVETQKNKDQQFYLTFDEFVLSLMYIGIMSRFKDRSRKILPSDVDNFTGELLEKFFLFLGFKVPFIKKDLDEFINSRRALSAKELFLLQREIRKKKVENFKASQTERDVKERKEKKLQDFNIEHKKRVKQREEDELKEMKRRKKERNCSDENKENVIEHTKDINISEIGNKESNPNKIDKENEEEKDFSQKNKQNENNDEPTKNEENGNNSVHFENNDDIIENEKVEDDNNNNENLEIENNEKKKIKKKTKKKKKKELNVL